MQISEAQVSHTLLKINLNLKLLLNKITFWTKPFSFSGIYLFTVHVSELLLFLRISMG